MLSRLVLLVGRKLGSDYLIEIPCIITLIYSLLLIISSDAIRNVIIDRTSFWSFLIRSNMNADRVSVHIALDHVSQPLTTQDLILVQHAATITQQSLDIYLDLVQFPTDRAQAWTPLNVILGTLYSHAAQYVKDSLVDVNVWIKGFGREPESSGALVCWNDEISTVNLVDILNSRYQDVIRIPRPEKSEAVYPEPELSKANKSHDHVALGGTFDHLHSGHKILLTMALWICNSRLVVGVYGTRQWITF
jgi:hypothetical protein